MALEDSTLQVMGQNLTTLVTHLQLHTGDPGAAGTANLTTAARQPVSFNVDADGDLTITGTVNFTGGAANGPCTWVSLWNALSAGTFRGRYQLTGDLTFNAAGEYSITGLTINGVAA